MERFRTCPAKRTALLALLAVLAARSAVAVDQQAACVELGFTGTQSCGDCEVFAEYVKDEELVADCKRCCVKDAAQQKYTSGALEVCSYRLQGLPQIQDFIQKKAKAYPNLKVRHEFGTHPQLRMKGPGGTDTIRIDNWKMASIVEFLNERLEAPATA